MGTPRGGDDVIRLGSKKPSGFKSKLESFLTKTAVLEAGILGTLLGGPVGGLKAAGLTALGLGIAKTSPKARKFVVQKIKDPTAGGRFIGEQIENIGKDNLPRDKSLGEKIKEGAKKAGIIGAITAGGIGAAVVGKKIIEKVKKAKVPKISEIIPGVAAAPALAQLPQSITPQLQPLGPAEKPPKEEKVVAVAPTMPSITNKIRVAPEINIRFSKRRTFINQQILVK